MAHYGQDPADGAGADRGEPPMRGRTLARIAALTQAVLLAGALIVPSSVAAATYGFTLNAPSPSSVQYSDFTTLSGAYTCTNDGGGNCPATGSSATAYFEVRQHGTPDWYPVADVTNQFGFGSSCGSTCTFSFSRAWQAGVAIPFGPGDYDIRVTTSIAGGEQVLLSALTITKEATTTTYTGETSGAADTELTLGAWVHDEDLGVPGDVNGIFGDDLFGFGISWELFDSTNTTSLAGPVGGIILSDGEAFASDTLHLPAAGGTYKLRTTYAGNDYYADSSDLTEITVLGGGTGTNTPPSLVLPGAVTAEATSSAGAYVTYVVSATDAEDDPAPTPSCDIPSGSLFPIGDTTVECTVTDSGSLTDTGSFTVHVEDTTDPVVVISTTESDNGDGWYSIASNDGNPGVTVDVSTSDAVGATYLSCTDNGDSVGALAATGDSFVLGDGVHDIACSASDWAGNVGGDTAPFAVDQTPPGSLAFVGGGLSDGAEYVFGSVPAGPTGCTASDPGSGLASCSVSGYSDLVGSQTVTALATDNAGNTGSATLGYTVLAWTLVGFGNPVSATSTNLVKAGSSVNLKFEVFAGATELSSLDAVVGVYEMPVVCGILIPLGPATPAMSSKGAGLRYDASVGQYLTKWDVPDTAGTCWVVSMVTADGSSLHAVFQTK
jgi:hypothetical protein